MGSVLADQDAYYQDNLDEEDLKYLLTKWGAAYRPSQLVAMEKMYQEYERENELNADRADALRKICRTSVKMDEAMEVGDYHSYKNLSQVYDQLRKSARFTDSQKKEDDSREIDSIGELVAFVEREGGAARDSVAARQVGARRQARPVGAYVARVPGWFGRNRFRGRACRRAPTRVPSRK